MNRLQTNILANLAGQGWAAAVQLALIPFYIAVLGIEAYGLIGFYVTLQAVLTVLDLGVSPTLNRELARYSARPDRGGEARDLVRTLEVGYWAAGLVIGGAILAAASTIASRWLQAISIPPVVLRRVIMLMAVASALQWPLSFYQGGLLGLQRQAVLNGIRIGVTTLGGLGAVLVLTRVSPTITAYFCWQIAVSAVHLGLVTRALWRRLPPSDHAPRLAPSLLRGVWRFAAGMSGITAASLVLTQLDKVLLSRLLSLDAFGYYALASVVSNGLYVLVNPVFNAVFPRFSALAALGEEASLRELYHRASQFMAVLIMPLASLLALFSRECLTLWTGNVSASRNAAPIVSFLVTGTALNGLMTLPYGMQLAQASTRIALAITASLIVVQVPAVVWMGLRYGAAGAAAVWMALNLAYMLIGVPLTHRRLLPGDMKRWFGEDVGIPSAAALAVAGLGRWLTWPPGSGRATPGALLLLLIASGAAAAAAAPHTRAWLMQRLVRWR